MIQRIKPFIKKDWTDYMSEHIINFDYYKNNHREELETRFKYFFEMDHCFLVSSATIGLMVSLLSLELNPGDEVLLPDYGHPAAAQMCQLLNINFTTVDMDYETKAVDINLLRRSITSKTKCFIHVETNGWLTESIQDIANVCKEYGIKLIEDSAPSLGQRYKDKLAGTFGDIGVFSFSSTKPLFCGEGGLIITSNEKIALTIERLQKSTHTSPLIQQEGNFNISPFSAMFLLRQFDDLSEILAIRRSIHNSYKSKINIYSPTDVTQYYGAVSLFTNSAEEIHNKLKRFYIESRINGYPCINNLPVSTLLRNETIDLPSHFNLTEEQINAVCNLIR